MNCYITSTANDSELEKDTAFKASVFQDRTLTQFNPAGFLLLNKSTVKGIFSVFVSYFIVMMQFKVSF